MPGTATQAELKPVSGSNTPLISVIVPVYNVSEYLDENIASIIGQSYRNLEIILVDDGSTDGCPQKCDRYAAMDQRIKVIHKSNGGQSEARNVALDVCSGAYITFIDSDDVVSKDYVKILYDILAVHGLEISVCKYRAFKSKIPQDKSGKARATVYEAQDAVKALLDGRPFTTSPWAKLYSRRLFQTLRFPLGLNFEDLVTVWRPFSMVERVAYTPCVLYYYRLNPRGITGYRFTPRKMDVIKAHDIVLKEIPEVFPALTHSVRARFGCNAATHLYQALRCSFNDYDTLKALQAPLKQHLKPLISGHYPLSVKLFAFLAHYDAIFNLLCRKNAGQDTM